MWSRPWSKLLSGCVNYSASRQENQASGQNPLDAASIPITTPQRLRGSGWDTLRGGPRAEIDLVAVPHPGKVDGNSSWVCSSRTQPFQLCSFFFPASSKALSRGMDLNAAPQQEGSPGSGQAGPGTFPCAGEMGLKDGGRMKDGVSHIQAPASRGVSHLFYFIPPKNDHEGFYLALNREATSPRFLESPRQTPDLHPPGCTFSRPFAGRENPDHSLMTTRLCPVSRNPCNYLNIGQKSDTSHPPAAG